MKYFSDESVQDRAEALLNSLAAETGLTVINRTLRHPDLGAVVEIREMCTGPTWKPRRTGKLYINVGYFGRRKQFSERKDGSFSPELVPYIKQYVESERFRQSHQRRRAEAYETATLMLRETNLSPRERVAIDPTVVGDPNETYGMLPGIKLTVSLPITELDRVRRFLKEIPEV